MTQVQHMITSTGGHAGGETAPAIEVWFTVDGQSVMLTDSEGTPLRDSWGEIVKGQMTPGQIINPRVVASRLALRRWRATRDWKDDFHRNIDPREYAKVPA
jgi:hypothetical protein